jgi:hypothetical protein
MKAAGRNTWGIGLGTTLLLNIWLTFKALNWIWLEPKLSFSINNFVISPTNRPSYKNKKRLGHQTLGAFFVYSDDFSAEANGFIR